MHRDELDHSVASIIAFCQFARTQELFVGIQQTMAAIEAVRLIGGVGPREFAFSLRAALTSSKEEWDLFNRLFETFWGESQHRSSPASEGTEEAKINAREQKTTSQTLKSLSTGDPSSAKGDGKTVTGASTQQRIQTMDFSKVAPDDLVALEEVSQRLFRRMSLRLSRRRKIRNLADRVDVRRTIRRSIPRGGDPIVLAFQGRKPQKYRLVVFLDISGSMNAYSLFLVRFAFALQKYFKHVDTFLFSTNVVEITDVLRTRDLPDAFLRLSQRAAGWAGGTKIGESLSDFYRQYGRKLLSTQTVFIILSDGWDTGEPELLAAQLHRIRRHVQKLIWLNPLLGLKEYEPITRGMSAALPYVDIFAPAHNIESLLALDRFL